MIRGCHPRISQTRLPLQGPSASLALGKRAGTSAQVTRVTINFNELQLDFSVSFRYQLFCF
jgi:hypothetical protein